MTKNGELDWVAISIWNAVHRPLWCIGVGTIAVLCDLNYGFLINWFLSCKVKFNESISGLQSKLTVPGVYFIYISAIIICGKIIVLHVSLPLLHHWNVAG